MAYSGTYGETIINVQTLIDHGARRCGKLAEELTSEQVVSARQSLHYLLSNLINIGIQYWAIGNITLGTTPEKSTYLLPVGGVDVLNALYRQMQRPAPGQGGGYYGTNGIIANAFDGNVLTKDIQTTPNGYLMVDYGTNNSQYIGSLGILPGVSGEFHIVYEYSRDGLVWNTLYDCGVQTWVDNEWLWVNLNAGQEVQYYRMRETGGNTLVVREWYLGNQAKEVPMARLNRDDYSNLPNKFFTANQPYQFWVNRTIPQVEVVLWPVPNDPFIQMTLWYSKQIMDVGDLTDELQIPQRWYMAVQSMLAHQMSLELPGVDLARVQYLEGQADKHLQLAEQEERDKSPIYFAPNISVYTR